MNRSPCYTDVIFGSVTIQLWNTRVSHWESVAAALFGCLGLIQKKTRIQNKSDILVSVTKTFKGKKRKPLVLSHSLVFPICFFYIIVFLFYVLLYEYDFYSAQCKNVTELQGYLSVITILSFWIRKCFNPWNRLFFFPHNFLCGLLIVFCITVLIKWAVVEKVSRYLLVFLAGLFAWYLSFSLCTLAFS